MDGEPSEPLAQPVVVLENFTLPRETWRSMDTRQDALLVMGCRLGEEAQEFTTVTCVVTELKSVLGRRKTILVL